MAGKRGSRPARGRTEEQARRRLVIGTVVAAAVVVLFVIGYLGQQPQAGSDGDPFALAVQPMAGNPSAPVTVVEFGDFKCPYCAMFATEFYPALREAYVDTGKARFYFINFAFIGADSLTAAAAGEAVYDQDPEAFWAFYEALYANQGPEDQEWATPEVLLDLARQAAPGLDFEALERALDNPAYRERVEADIEIARRLGVRGVPALFVDGERVEDWTLDGLSAAIDAALAEQGSESP
ncbi:MAG TPA: DsbA family protein [Bacillota bacterium]